jgi:hypothetical protein
VVPGVLKVYDLPDLAAALAPRPVRLVDATDPLGKPVTLEQAQEVYGGRGASHIRVYRRGPSTPFLEPYRELLPDSKVL